MLHTTSHTTTLLIQDTQQPLPLLFHSVACAIDPNVNMII
jgi:hypothetical protein